MKFCKDCKWAVPHPQYKGDSFLLCSHPSDRKETEIDLVTGINSVTGDMWYCSARRLPSSGGRFFKWGCGVKGNQWEPK